MRLFKRLSRETGWYLDRLWQENEDRQFPWMQYRHRRAYW